MRSHTFELVLSSNTPFDGPLYTVTNVDVSTDWATSNIRLISDIILRRSHFTDLHKSQRSFNIDQRNSGAYPPTTISTRKDFPERRFSIIQGLEKSATLISALFRILQVAAVGKLACSPTVPVLRTRRQESLKQRIFQFDLRILHIIARSSQGTCFSRIYLSLIASVWIISRFA